MLRVFHGIVIRLSDYVVIPVSGRKFPDRILPAVHAVMVFCFSCRGYWLC